MGHRSVFNLGFEDILVEEKADRGISPVHEQLRAVSQGVLDILPVQTKNAIDPCCHSSLLFSLAE